MREPGHYRILVDHPKEEDRRRGFRAGQMVLMEVDDDPEGDGCIEFWLGDHCWCYGPSEAEAFDATFERVVNGAAIRQHQIGQLIQEIDEIGVELDGEQRQLTCLDPYGEPSTSTELAVARMESVKRHVATTRNTVLKVQKHLEAKQGELKRLLDEQVRALASKRSELDRLVKTAEEAIWSINLYLGRGEEIVELRSGAPAPLDDPIVIHQNLRYMDEECGLDAREGGITFANVAAFDRWLLADPANLDRVIPSSKGIVVFHVKRSDDKQYHSPWEASDKLNANLCWTYFLIRNGERLYRVYADIVVGQRLFPEPDDYQSVFVRNDRRYEASETNEYLKPGTREYMKALEEAADKQRHYLRILLILQGLLDRTPIFHPMPVARVNLCDPDSYGGLVQLYRSDHLVLTDGRPTFAEWNHAINQRIDVGCRIIGTFDYRADIRESKYNEGRIHPAGARYPDSLVLYTLEERDGDHFIFRYHRNEEVRKGGWSSWEYGPAVQRASCWVGRDDRFFLAFDAATEEELAYYAGHRASRKEYRDALPLIEIALKLKRQEREDEQPFRQLLVGQLAQQADSSFESAEATVDELITWWKFKNRTHRALLSDDAKALRMIVDEFNLRRQQQLVRDRLAVVTQQVVDLILANNPDVLLIAHKRDNEYVVLTPENDQDVFVSEQVWRYRPSLGDVVATPAKRWKVLDNRWQRWELLHRSDRWEGWHRNPVATSMLTGPDLEELERKLFEEALTRGKAAEVSEARRNRQVTPLCLCHDDDFKVYLYYLSQSAVVPEQLLVSSPKHRPKVSRVDVPWRKTRDSLEVPVIRFYNASTFSEFDVDEPMWAGNHHYRRRPDHIVRLWPSHLDEYRRQMEAAVTVREAAKRLRAIYAYVRPLVEQDLHERQLLTARVEFDREFGDPDLWEDHLKSLKLQRPTCYAVEVALNLWAERHLDPVGRTLGEIVDAAAAWDPPKPGWNGRPDGTFRPEMLAVVPREWVVPPAPPTVVEELDD